MDTTHSPSFLFLNSFRHRNADNQAEIFGAAEGPEMANIEQMKKIIPLITHEISFQSTCLPVGVWSQCNGFGFWCIVTDLDFGVQIDPVKQPIQSNSVGP